MNKQFFEKLEEEYEKTRLAWNASSDHRERCRLSDHLNAIRSRQYLLCEEEEEEDDTPPSSSSPFGSGSLGKTYDI